MEPFNPLTPEHYGIASQTCEECARLREYLGRLRELGLQVDDKLAQVDAIETFMSGVRKQFFPHMT